MAQAAQLNVRARRRIMKFAEGADPNVDAPYEIEEQEVVLTEPEAQQVLDRLGLSNDSALRLAKEAQKNGSNT